MPDYLVVARAQSGVRLGRDDPLAVSEFPTPIGKVTIEVRTRLTTFDGFSKPVPMGLMAEIRGGAPSLDEALQEFTRAAQNLCPVLAFIGNSAIEDLIPEICYDISPGMTERDFFQQFLPEERLMLIDRRRLSAALIVRVLKALWEHEERERIHRAMGQYHQALNSWQPGMDVLALAHLWMGVEALTPVILRRILRETKLTSAALAAAWGIDIKQLDGEIRKREIMGGDVAAYKAAKEASDGFEHGFLNLHAVYAISRKVRVEVATYLRQSILQELRLESSDVETITKPPLNTPGHLHSAKYMRGKLIARSEILSAPNQLYPMLRWKTSYRDISDPSSDEVKIDVDETFSPLVAPEVSFRPSSIEVWGGQEASLKKAENAAPKIARDTGGVTSAVLSKPRQRIPNGRRISILLVSGALILIGVFFLMTRK